MNKSHDTKKSNVIKKTFLWETFNKSNTNLKKKPYIYSHFQESFARIDTIATAPLKLAVLGEFNAGKSSFINRLIGKDILPASLIPETATNTVLKYSTEEKIEIDYKDNNGLTNTKVYEGYDKLEQYQKSESKDSDLVTIEEIRVFVDNEMLKYFNIIDTPGSNDATDISQTAESLFDKVNYVIWIFNAVQAGKGTEKDSLEKFREKSLYKNNIYAIINHGDTVVTGKDNYKSKATELREKHPLKHLFVNDKIHIISCKETDTFWTEKFKNLEDDLKKRILHADTKISENQLCEELIKLNDKINVTVQQLETLDSDLKNECTTFLSAQRNNDTTNLQLKSDIVDIIKNNVIRTEERIRNSKIYNEQDVYVKALLKFASFYMTAESLETIEEEIKKKYGKYLSAFVDSYTLFKNLILSLNATNSIKDNEFSNTINKELDKVSSILDAMHQSKKLLIVGYIIGVLSDDFVYFCIQDGKEAAVEKLSEGTILNLLDMDLDFKLFFKIIKNMERDMREHLEEDKAILNKSTTSLNEFINSDHFLKLIHK